MFTNKIQKIHKIRHKLPDFFGNIKLFKKLVHEFIEKIIVYPAKYLDGKRFQLVDIYYNGIGIIRGLTPEDMADCIERELEQNEKTA